MNTVKTRVFAQMFKFNTPGRSMLITIETYTKIKGFHGYHGGGGVKCKHLYEHPIFKRVFVFQLLQLRILP